MRILVLNHDYGAFLDWLYETNEGLADASYEDQCEARRASLFGDAYFYPEHFRELGHEAHGVYVNNENMQTAWAREHDVLDADGTTGATTVLDDLKGWAAETPLRRLEPLVRSMLGDELTEPSWYYDILEAQIDHYDPDVILNQAVDGISSDFLARVAPEVDLLAGQIAAPIPEWIDTDPYDLMFSALPHFVERFRDQGLASEYVKLAFEPTVLDALADPGEATYPVTFVGTLSDHHESRIRLLECLAREVPLHVWAPDTDDLPSDSPLHDCHHGQAWGREMFEVLQRSKITVNRHIDVAGEYAANLRMYEATGVGSMLLTDWKRNLDEIFDVGDEVVAYRSADGCVEMIRQYLDNDGERERIAGAGQERTLSDHTYRDRVKRMASLIESHHW